MASLHVDLFQKLGKTKALSSSYTARSPQLPMQITINVHKAHPKWTMICLSDCITQLILIFSHLFVHAYIHKSFSIYTCCFRQKHFHFCLGDPPDQPAAGTVSVALSHSVVPHAACM
uniref:Uncharacterized protein n=1 Tax=Xiphophorus maculatus TaxID=8083 RepID=A0A3B5QBN4_XIPMA